MALTQISTQGIKDGTITGTDLATNIDLVDNQKLRLGNNQNLQIYYDGSSYITNGTAGHIIIKTLNTGSDINLECHDDFFVKTANATQNSIIARDSGQVELYYSGSKKFESTSAGATVTGSLGIGTTSPSNNLHVHQGDSDKSIAQFTNTETGTASGDGFQIGITSSEEALLNMKESKAMLFKTADTERMQISSNGDITVNFDGAGNRTGQFKIADGNASIPGLTFWADGNGDTGIFRSGANTLNFTTGGNERMRIDSSGQLLIGTTSQTTSTGVITGIRAATESRIVVGNSNTSASGKCSYDMLPSNTVTGARIECRATEDFSTVANRTADLGFFTRKDGILSEKLTILSDGNVGLGVTSVSNARFRIKGVNNNTAAFNDGLMVTSNNETVYKKYSWAGIETKGGMVFSETNSGSLVETMRIDTSGRVGIGTTSPAFKLDITGSGTGNGSTLNINDAASSADSRHIKLTRASTAAYIGIAGSVANDPFFINRTGNNSDLVIDSSGNVGIGTSTIGNESEHKKLIISGASGNGAGILEFQDTSNNTDGAIFSDNGNLFIVADRDNTTSSSSIRFRVDGSSEKMRIDSSGNATLNSGSLILSTSGQGIEFHPSGASNANLLDDYEEGQFTPAFSGGLVFSTYNNNGQRGMYTRIGRFVYATIRLDGASSSTQNSNQILISGLPFTALGAQNGFQIGGADPFWQDGFYNANDFSGIVNEGQSVIQLVKRSDGSSLTGTDVNGGRQIRINVWYMAA